MKFSLRTVLVWVVFAAMTFALVCTSLKLAESRREIDRVRIRPGISTYWDTNNSYGELRFLHELSVSEKREVELCYLDGDASTIDTERFPLGNGSTLIGYYDVSNSNHQNRASILIGYISPWLEVPSHAISFPGEEKVIAQSMLREEADPLPLLVYWLVPEEVGSCPVPKEYWNKTSSLHDFQEMLMDLCRRHKVRCVYLRVP